MSLTTPVNGNTILATDISQLVKVLQETSGATEAGKYYIIGWGSASSDSIGTFFVSLSRTSTPVSVAIDTADVAASSINAPSTTNLKPAGFLVFSSSTGANTNCHVAGNTTIQF